MTLDEKELFLHVMKTIEDRDERHKKWKYRLIDSMFRELGIDKPIVKRNPEDRRNCSESER